MLVVSGIAESMKNNNQVVKGATHAFNLFCKADELETQLPSIEAYLNKKGWDNIVIEEQILLDDEASIEHDVLLEAFEIAKQNGISGVIHQTPMS